MMKEQKEITVKTLHMGPAACAVDLGDGSERGEYVNQDYILQKLGRPMRAINLMYCYYPLDKGFPERASVAFKDLDTHGEAWGYPYDDYFPYRGGLIGDREGEPFCFMKDVRRHGMDVLLTLTIDPHVSDEHIIAIAKDLRTYGRVQLRVNHEATGEWFSFNKRASYEEVANFFAHVCEIIHREAPNVNVILCLDGFKSLKAKKMEKEDQFIPAIKAGDIMSVDRYLALHWGWPGDVAERGGKSFARYSVEDIYELAKRSCKRYNEISGKKKPMVLSELNADADVTGPYDQCRMLKQFTDLIKNDKEKWLSAFTLYQFRDKGRLGLEIEDPNNQEVGIEQPLMNTFRDIISDPYFQPTIKNGKNVTLPVTLRWGGSEDAEGISMPLKFTGNPAFAELYFEDGLENLNLMMEFNGTWFYKAPGVSFVDLMPAFYKKPLEGAATIRLKIFAPPADGENHPEDGDDWMTNSYTEIPALPRVRIRQNPIVPEKKSEQNK